MGWNLPFFSSTEEGSRGLDFVPRGERLHAVAQESTCVVSVSVSVSVQVGLSGLDGGSGRMGFRLDQLAGSSSKFIHSLKSHRHSLSLVIVVLMRK
jgi:hypothetical protein